MKNLITTIYLFAFTLSVMAGGLSESIDFQVSFDENGPLYPSYPKSPIMPPSVSLDDHTLYFDTPCDGCTLNIVDENDVVVYTLFIPTGTTSLVLPSTLSGEYVLQIIRSNYLFWGYVTL
ncbi:MAG: DUF3244 domain-containing protein [Prevotella sp.]|nr:DUF3244 domain-containing protein [Prevotella sp.]